MNAILTDAQLAAIAAEAVVARQAGHPMVSIEDGLRAITSGRTELERLRMAQAARKRAAEVVGTVTEVGLMVLRAAFALSLL